MENKYLIGIGVIALGVFAYSRYAKKDDSGQEEDQGGGGGGIGGGGFMPNLPTPPTPPAPPTPPVTPARVGVTPTTRGTVVVAAPTTQMNNPLQSGITRSGISGTGMNTGGITGAGTGTGTATTVGTGAGSYMTTKVGGNVLTPFKPFSGCEPNGRRPIFLDDLVRSWNRP
jgi:hypothetical protein